MKKFSYPFEKSDHLAYSPGSPKKINFYPKSFLYLPAPPENNYSKKKKKITLERADFLTKKNLYVLVKIASEKNYWNCQKKTIFQTKNLLYSSEKLIVLAQKS